MHAESERRNTILIVLDQAVVSGGNFLTTLVLARALAPASYGTFSLVLLFLYAINTCHSSLVVYPLILRAAKGTPDDLGRATASGLAQTCILSAPLAIACLVFSVVLKQSHLAVAMIVAMIAWQLQETARRALLSSGNARKAILPDMLCYVGQAALLFAIKPGNISVILGVIVLTSCLALIWQMAALRLRPSHIATLQALQQDVRYGWKLGRHILGGNAFNMVALQTPSWMLAFFAGPIGVAGYQALLNLAGIANPIIFSVNTSLIPTVARSAEKGYVVARRTALRIGLQYGALLLPCFLLFGLLPRHVMQWIYGAGTPYLALSVLLPLFIAAYAIQYVATVIGAYEGGMSRPQTYFYVQSISTIALVGMAVPLIKLYGVRGAVIAVFGFSLFRLISFTIFSVHADRKGTSVPVTPTSFEDDDSTEPIAHVGPQIVTVCVLTYRRPVLLRKTLASLQAQTALQDESFRVNVVVVDNDLQGSAAEVVRDAQATFALPFEYVCNPANGLSTGRNLALDRSAGSHFVAFIDDDETASTTWLQELLHAADEYKADVVTGPVYPELGDAPEWITRGRFFSPSDRSTGAPVQHVATNNTVMRSSVTHKFRFDVRYDKTGGEDTDFFLRVSSAGHSMRWCREAVVTESVPESRANQNWIVQRARSDANRFTHGYLAMNPGMMPKMIRVVKSAAGMLMGTATLPLSVLGKQHHVRALSYMARASGTLAALRGKQHADYAGHDASAVAPNAKKAVAVVVVGQTPPPVNGQSIMIRDFVTGTYDDIAITYVPMHFSRTTNELGRFDFRKLFVAFAIIVAIARARFRSGARILYYPPAGANLVPVLRDFMILILCRPLFTKTAFHFHAAGLTQIYPRLPRLLRPLFRLAYNKPDLAIFTTAATAAEADFLHAGRTCIVACGVADPLEYAIPVPPVVRSQPTILFAGILCEGKGVFTLLQALAELRARGLPFRAELMGAFQSEDFERETKAYLQTHGLTDTVIFRGTLTGSEKFDAFHNADLFCFPSHYPAESFGVVLIEAMSHSLPIVATDWQGIPEVAGRDGEGSILVPIKNPFVLADAIDTVLQSETRRAAMGAHNRSRYLRYYTLSQYRSALSHCLSALD